MSRLSILWSNLKETGINRSGTEDPSSLEFGSRHALSAGTSLSGLEGAAPP